MPCLARSTADGEIEKITLGHPLLDDYLVFVAAALLYKQTTAGNSRRKPEA
jgi:hypothetical protein